MGDSSQEDEDSELPLSPEGGASRPLLLSPAAEGATLAAPLLLSPEGFVGEGPMLSPGDFEGECPLECPKGRRRALDLSTDQCFDFSGSW